MKLILINSAKYSLHCRRNWRHFSTEAFFDMSSVKGSPVLQTLSSSKVRTSIQIREILGKTACLWFQKAIGKDPHYQHSRKIDCHWRRVLTWLNNRTKAREQGSSKWSILTVKGHNQWSSPGTCSSQHVYKRWASRWQSSLILRSHSR